jgi:arylsulfatase A-like enzyme
MKEPFFMFLHYYDAHGPYREYPKFLAEITPVESGKKLKYIPRYQSLRDLDGQIIEDLDHYINSYDSQIRYQDDLIGEVLESIDLEQTLVVVLSDHGETLADRESRLNLTHGTSPYQEQISIPLLLHGPGLEFREVEAVVETVDLLPTLLELLRIDLPPALSLEGESLMPLITGESGQRRAPYAFSSSRTDQHRYYEKDYRLNESRMINAVQDSRWKLLVFPGLEEDYVELYDLLHDAAERHNLAAMNPKVKERLLAAINSWVPAQGQETPKPVDSPQDLDHLRALGYVN